jgi:hypothetical protein
MGPLLKHADLLDGVTVAKEIDVARRFPVLTVLMG